MTQPPRRKRPPFPWFGREQLWITVSLIAVMIGTFLPWFSTFLGSRFGIDTWGILATWGAAVGLTGALSMKPRWYRLMPGLGSLIALSVVVWMTVDAAQVCRPYSDGSTPCRPSIGLILSGAAAINALLWSVRAMRSFAPAPPGGAAMQADDNAKA